MSEWISVEDRLPDGMQRLDEEILYAAHLDAIYVSPVRVLATDGSLCRDASLNVCLSGSVYALNFTRKITHWMPLPEPPE